MSTHQAQESKARANVDEQGDDAEPAGFPTHENGEANSEGFHEVTIHHAVLPTSRRVPRGKIMLSQFSSSIVIIIFIQEEGSMDSPLGMWRPIANFLANKSLLLAVIYDWHYIIGET